MKGDNTLGMNPEYTIGDYEVESTDDGTLAVVRYLPTGKPMMRFTGETAALDARRYAQDMHVAMRGTF